MKPSEGEMPVGPNGKTAMLPLYFAVSDSPLVWKAERAAARTKTKRTLVFRHRLLGEVLKRVKPSLGCEEIRLVARFALEALPHEVACRLAKRHAAQNGKEGHGWPLAEKARKLYRNAEPPELARLIFEAILLGSAGVPEQSKEDDLLIEAATFCKLDLKTLRT
jgi:hypothetical protein